MLPVPRLSGCALAVQRHGGSVQVLAGVVNVEYPGSTGQILSDLAPNPLRAVGQHCQFNGSSQPQSARGPSPLRPQRLAGSDPGSRDPGRRFGQALVVPVLQVGDGPAPRPLGEDAQADLTPAAGGVDGRPVGLKLNLPWAARNVWLASACSRCQARIRPPC